MTTENKDNGTDAVKTTPPDPMEEARQKHRHRAMLIVKQCAFGPQVLSKPANDAHKSIIDMFSEITYHLAMMLPSNAHSALCLEYMEAACMWAEKAVKVHDSAVALQNAPKQVPKEN